MRRLWIAVFLLPLIAQVAGTAQPAGDASLKLTPRVIEMGAFYGGAAMRIEGVAEPGSKVVVVVRGPDTEEVFNVKQQMGPLWINTGQVHISGIPSLLLAFSSESMSGFLGRESIEKYQLDDAAIQAQMRIEPAPANPEVIRTHYLSFKADGGLYATFNDGLQMGRPGPEGVPFTVELQWPKIAPPASYEVRAYQCRDGSVFKVSSAPLEVVKVGFPKEMAHLAQDRAPLYGMMAVFIALLAGFGIDFIASRLSKKGAVSH